MFFESFLTVIVTKKAACENARTQVALDFEGFWRFVLTTLEEAASVRLRFPSKRRETPVLLHF